jgi:hypothetical protein
VSRFYQFLAKHRRANTPVFATIKGRLVKGEDDGFIAKRDLVFMMESVSEISEVETGEVNHN